MFYNFSDIDGKVLSESGLDFTNEENHLFSPAKGNVVFASAYDGWAFRLNQFSNMYAKKLELDATLLRRTLWGEFTFSSKLKKITKWKPEEVE